MPKSPRRSIGRLLWRGLLGLLALAGGLLVLFYLATVRPDRRSVPYQQAMEHLRENDSAAHLMGPPVKAGWWVRGQATADSARFAIPVSGRARQGTFRVKAEKVGGAWLFSRLTLALTDNNIRLSLLEPERQQEEPRDSLTVPPQYLK